MAATFDGFAGKLPRFEDLPLRPGDPPYSAWGLWGDRDELGRLNLLTDDKVAEAARDEIRSGKRIPLDLPLKSPKYPSFKRESLDHKIIHKAPRTVYDDHLSFNSQASTQWDGLRHFAYQASGLFYGGRNAQETAAAEPINDVIGIQNMSNSGIHGRGVLIDFYTYAQKHGIVYDPADTYSITFNDLQACIAEQGQTFRHADILFIRMGFAARLKEMDDSELLSISNRSVSSFAGIEQDVQYARWIWENHFAAVASDAVAFECYPPRKDWALHEYLLSGWGCPIGEMFDLDALSEALRQQTRWSFFLASKPLNVPGGVASPANAMAIL